MRQAGYLTLCATGLAIALFSIASLSMSLPEDEMGPGVSRATLVRRRGCAHASHTSSDACTRSSRCVASCKTLRPSTAEAGCCHRRRRRRRLYRRRASAAEEPHRYHRQRRQGAQYRGGCCHRSRFHLSAATAAATAAATSSSAAAAARRARRGPRRPAPVAASPPPAMGPPLLLRPGKEAACLAHRGTPLEALARATCSLSEARQQFVYGRRALVTK